MAFKSYIPLYTHDQFDGLHQFVLNSGNIIMCSRVIEFLTAENIIPTEIHRHLKAVYGENPVE